MCSKPILISEIYNNEILMSVMSIIYIFNVYKLFSFSGNFLAAHAGEWMFTASPNHGWQLESNTCPAERLWEILLCCHGKFCIF